MKPTLTLTGLLLASVAIIGCAAFGSNPTPPNKVEQALFNTVTNEVYKTNIVAEVVPVYRTNEIIKTITNQLNQVIPVLSNEVVQVYVTNYIAQVVTNPAYVNTVKPETKEGVAVVGKAVDTVAPGMGTLVSLAANGVLALWAWLRSSKAKQFVNTASVLSQELETVRSFLKNLPNGAAYDAQFVAFLQAHQNEMGVTQQVIQLLNNYVSNPDAKVAAQTMVEAINALKSTATPLPPISAA